MKWTEMCFVVPVQSWRFLLKSARCLLCDLAPFPTVPPCQTVIRRSNYRWFAAYYMAFTSRSIRFSPVTCSNHFTHFQLDLFDFFWLEWCVTTIAWNKPRCWVCCLECCKLPEYFFFGIPNLNWTHPAQPILGWNWNLGRPSKNSNSGKPTLQFIYQQKPMLHPSYTLIEILLVHCRLWALARRLQGAVGEKCCWHLWPWYISFNWYQIWFMIYICT